MCLARFFHKAKSEMLRQRLPKRITVTRAERVQTVLHGAYVLGFSRKQRGGVDWHRPGHMRLCSEQAHATLALAAALHSNPTGPAPSRRSATRDRPARAEVRPLCHCHL